MERKNKRKPQERDFASVSVKKVDKVLEETLTDVFNKAIPLESAVNRAKCFYEIQTLHELGTKDDQIKIGVHLTTNISTYTHHIDKAIADINLAAPGIQLYKTDKKDSKITIDEVNGGCNTSGTYKTHAYVKLDPDWENDWKGQTTIHELLHALGFEHEFKRKDASKYVTFSTENEQYIDQKDNQTIRGLTRFDPFSVMMYPEDSYMERNDSGNLVWKLKSGKVPKKEMSELDKVALNMVFRPCKGDDYDPVISEETGMLYCERYVMSGNQHPFKTLTNGVCGPNNWANCPACRVQITDKKYKDMHALGKWQGWSGLFYCGNKMSDSDDTVCGPDTGLPCNQCGRALYAEYDYSEEIK